MSGNGIRFLEKLCIECHGCEVACKSWNQIEPGISLRQIYKTWDERDPLLAKRIPATKACHHCEDPACAQACPASAIVKSAGGLAVLVDRKLCIGCRICLEACSYGVPQFGADRTMQKCSLCMSTTGNHGMDVQPCVATCPTGALQRP